MLIFLRQQNGALLVEILYFLAGSVMHHSGVVNNTIGALLRARVVKRVGLAGNHSIHTGRNTSGGTRRLDFITIKKFIPCIDQPPYLAVFFILNSKKENTDTDNVRVAMPCKSAMNMAQKKRGCRINAAGQSP
ncbi:TPA: hypothetical protein KJF54_005286 [Escherichia coli]|uniref:Uncharacterized protein n=2 Tax=Escherichia coli TaxID=562 RepID=A0A2S8JJ25_ECOLX|nr:hypothetical protein [Escherichia coli]EED0148158.1 hypothetical protein [Escherichia coli]EEW8463768.1 hypothetical protein [Escherichia coli]EFB2389690.1 hypothetical protein [Escherichia coli]EFB2400458.1 hypothetical protein [Escherichia coli]EFB2405895.1 hypothetical protein [Escherichia coli]